ncbi:MAG: LysM peptidoglycan-binding domain-containing protein [Chloroflexi bacterium]|nr:LysM peptidoglycan-binding domain-containing protein [Chloroflexota bacterium]
MLLLAMVMLLALTATTQAAPAEAPAQSTGVYHTVRWGESLSGIAVRYGVTVQAIMAVNPQIWNPNVIYAGQVLFIPTGGTGESRPALAAFIIRWCVEIRCLGFQAGMA